MSRTNAQKGLDIIYLTFSIVFYLAEVHKQLGDQLKFFDARTESKLSVLADYQEFYKRLGEVELEHARNLDKLAERFQDRLRQKLQRKDKMNTVDIFSRILQDLKSRAKIRVFMATRLSENMSNRFGMIIEDVQRVNKKVSCFLGRCAFLQ